MTGRSPKATTCLSPPRRVAAARGPDLLGGRTKLTTDQACVRQRSSVLSYPLRKTVIFRSLTTVVALAHHAWFLVTWVTYKRPPAYRLTVVPRTNYDPTSEHPEPPCTQLWNPPPTSLQPPKPRSNHQQAPRPPPTNTILFLRPISQQSPKVAHVQPSRAVGEAVA